MQLPHLGYAIATSRRAIVATMFSKGPFREGVGGGFPHPFHLDILAPRGIDFTHRLLGSVTLGLLGIVHPAMLARYEFEPRTPTRLFEPDDKVHRLYRKAEGEQLLPHYIAVGINGAGLSLEFAMHDDDHRCIGQPAFASLRTLELYGPDKAATVIGTSVLDMLRALHPEPFAPFPSF